MGNVGQLKKSTLRAMDQGEGKSGEQSWHRGRREAKARVTLGVGDGKEEMRKEKSGRAASISEGN